MRGAQGIVAMGTIQLRNSGNTATGNSVNGVDQQTGLQNEQQPAINGAVQQQRQISNPGADFNPSR